MKGLMPREIKLPTQGHTAASGKIRSHEHFEPWSWPRLTSAQLPRSPHHDLVDSYSPPGPGPGAGGGGGENRAETVSESAPGRKAGVRGQLKMGVWPPFPRASGIHQPVRESALLGHTAIQGSRASPSPPVTRSTQSLVHTPIRNPIISVS